MSSMDIVKKRIIISMVAIILLIITLFGITYAYFIAKVKGNTNDRSVSVSAGILKLTYGDGNSNITAEKIIPGTNITKKTFTVKNTGTDIVENYDVYLENVINDLENYKDLTYVLTCESDDENECVGSEGVFPKSGQVIATNSIRAGVTHTYEIVLTYKETNTDQSIDMNKTIDAKINIKDDISNIKKLNIYGNSIQNETPTSENSVEVISLGDKTKNLFSGIDIGVAISSTNGVTSIRDDYASSDFIPFESGQTYTLSGGENSRLYARFYAYNKNFEYIGASPGSSGISPRRVNAESFNTLATDLPENLEIKYVKIAFYENVNLVGTIDEVSDWNLQFEMSSSASNYEPYGYKIPLTTIGKNLFDKNSVLTGFSVDNTNGAVVSKTGVSLSDFIQVKENTTYTISGYTSSLDETYNIAFYDENKEFISGSNNFSTFVVPEGAVYVRKAFADSDLDKIQIEEGTQVSTFESYNEWTSYIYLKEPLRKINDYVDYIDYENKIVVRNVKEYILNGTENWELQTINDNNIASYKTDLIKKINKTNYISNRFIKQSVSIDDFSNEGMFYSNDKQFYIGINSNKASSVQAFKEWLNSNITKVYVQLPSKEYEEVLMPELGKIENRTIKVCDNNNICASNIEIEYDN